MRQTTIATEGIDDEGGINNVFANASAGEEDCLITPDAGSRIPTAMTI
jgi:hypothetical protein